MSTENTVACKSCRGSGELTISSVLPVTMVCTVCKGVGRGRYVEVPCAACGGARGLPCSRCSGSGLVTVFQPLHQPNEAAPAE